MEKKRKVKIGNTTIEVYDDKDFRMLVNRIFKEHKELSMMRSNHDATEHYQVPEVQDIVVAIKECQNSMTHTYTQLMVKMLKRKVGSTGEERGIYDVFVRRVKSAQDIIAKELDGRFESKLLLERENGRMKKYNEFRFVKDITKM